MMIVLSIVLFYLESVVHWYSFSNPRTECIHCDNCLVIRVFFNTNALPRFAIGADVWGESDIMTGVY